MLLCLCMSPLFVALALWLVPSESEPWYLIEKSITPSPMQWNQHEILIDYPSAQLLKEKWIVMTETLEYQRISFLLLTGESKLTWIFDIQISYSTGIFFGRQNNWNSTRLRKSENFLKSVALMVPSSETLSLPRLGCERKLTGLFGVVGGNLGEVCRSLPRLVYCLSC
jgi:hypothetical protein